jgi:flagellar hook-associated protein 1 FlgK
MSGSLNSITNNAASGLAASKAAIALVSDNIANAGVAGYTAKTLDQSAFEVGTQSYGVRTGQVSRSVDAALQASVWSSTSSVGGLTIQSQVLQAVNATQGTPGDGTSLADAVSALQSSFTQLQAQPSATTQQSAVVQAAGTLASTINNTANTITAERNSVQTQIVTTVDALNAALATVQSTTHDLMGAIAAHGSAADLADQRDVALQTLSSTLNLHYSEQTNGNITILGQNGLSIPLDSRFSTGSAVLSATSIYTAGGTSVPPILMQSSNPAIPPTDVTSQLSGGQLGALIQLRDTTLPAYTASLDTFSTNLATQFNAQGLQLFTGPAGATISTTPAGQSSQIQVNSLVAATPSLVRDGTPTATTTNSNPTSVAGFTGVIDNVLNTTFPGTITTLSLATQAQTFVSLQSADTAHASADLSKATAYQTTVAGALSSGSGVNVDQQMGLMIQLQNSYQANARVIQATETLFTALLNIFNPA